jgi:hypothetical protein
MRNCVLLFICLGLLWPSILLTVNLAHAGDDDLTSSVYLVFDPETGEFVSVADANRAKQKHEALEPGETATIKPADKPSLPPSVGIAVAVGLLLSAIAWVQIKRRKALNGLGSE